MWTLSLSLSFRLRSGQSLTPAFRLTAFGAGVLLLSYLPRTAAYGQPAKPGTGPAQVSVPWKDFVATKTKAQELAGQGKTEDAIAGCEAFIRKHAAGEKGYPGRMAMLAAVVSNFLRDLNDEAARTGHYQRILKEFRDVPAYAAMAGTDYVNHVLWQKKDPETAEKIGRDALASFPDGPPASFHGSMLLVNVGHALRRQGKTEDAREMASRAAFLFPTVLEQKGLHQLLFECARIDKDWDKALSAAKLAYVLSDFTEEGIGSATKMVVAALTAKGGPGLAGQFLKSQESPDTDRPLKDVALPTFEPPKDGPADLLAAAGDDRHGRVNAQLAMGDYAGALADALDEMREALVNEQMAKSLRDVARCFRAKDLNLARANQFLEFQKTGAGHNPLPEF